MSLIKNASPQVILLGTEDKSTRVVTPDNEPLPQHLPLFMVFAKKGTTGRIIVDANEARLRYGDATFDANDKFYNHATRYLLAALGTPNKCMVKRIVPSDAGAKSNIAIYIDILESNIPNYIRNSYGKLVADVNTNDYKVDPINPTIPGYKIKFISEVATKDLDFGKLEVKEGTQRETVINADGSKTERVSTMYPFLQAKASYQGEDYNNIGFTINSLTGDNFDSSLASKLKSYLYSFSLYTRTSSAASGSLYSSLYGETAVQFVFKEKAINPNTEARVDFEYMFANNWFNEKNNLMSTKPYDYEGIYIYHDYFNTVLKKLIAKEKAYVTLTETEWNDGESASTFGWYDFSTADSKKLDEEYGLLNPFTCRTSKDIKYFTFCIADENPTLAKNQKEINVTDTTPIYLNGGKDGTLSNEEFEAAVVSEMAKYLDTDSEYHDLAINVESVFYDSGFTLPTKKQLINFIAQRKDTSIALTTHDDSIGNKKLPLSEIRAIALALGNRIKLAPESTYFGTPVCRGTVIPFIGWLRDGTENPVPGTYWLLTKAAKMMGKSTGKWDRSAIFDKYPGNLIDNLIDIHPAFIPAGIKPTLWDEGLVWAQPYNRDSYQVPAMQTVYDNDTSVLNSYFPMMALCYCNKVAAEVWRELTGTTDLTDAEFVELCTNKFNEKLNNIFDGIVTVIPVVEITAKDAQRGYSWTTTIKLYGGVMKTVMTHQIQAFRFSDLES